MREESAGAGSGGGRGAHLKVEEAVGEVRAAVLLADARHAAQLQAGGGDVRERVGDGAVMAREVGAAEGQGLAELAARLLEAVLLREAVAQPHAHAGELQLRRPHGCRRRLRHGRRRRIRRS